MKKSAQMMLQARNFFQLLKHKTNIFSLLKSGKRISCNFVDFLIMETNIKLFFDENFIHNFITTSVESMNNDDGNDRLQTSLT